MLEGVLKKGNLDTKEELKKVGDFDALSVAVCDLLDELRITQNDLEVMGNGYSPHYWGGTNKELGKSNARVQLSSVVANKLINSLTKK